MTFSAFGIIISSVKEKLAKLIVKGRFICLAVAVALTVASVFLMPYVNVNYDLSTYLSQKTETKKALDAMQGEFEEVSSVKLFCEGKSKEEAEALADDIKKIEGVILVTTRYEGDDALININMGCGNQSERAVEITAAIREKASGEGFTLIGSSVTSENLRIAISEEMPIIMIIAVVIVLLVLLLTSRSWLEPLIFFVVVAMAIIMNMGTNFVFGSISYITNAVGAILQLALAMDYSIIFLNNFAAAEGSGLKGKDAVADALAKSLAPVASSALTTIAGLLALVFMSFRIGFDIGCVLSKGIIFSMLSVFLVMPSLVLLLEKPLIKLSHKTVPLFGDKIAKVSIKCRKVLPVIFACLVVTAAVFSNISTTYSFVGAMRTDDEALIAQKMGESSQVVILYDGKLDSQSERELTDNLAALQNVTSVTSWGAMRLSPELIAQASEKITPQTATLLIAFLPEELTYLDALYDAASASENFIADRFADKLSAERLSEISGLDTQTSANIISVFGDRNGVSVNELAGFFEKQLTATQLSTLGGLDNLSASMIVLAAGENGKITIRQLKDFLESERGQNIVSSSQELKEKADNALSGINSAQSMLSLAESIKDNSEEYSSLLLSALSKARSALVGNSGRYKRMLLDVSLFIEDEKSYELLDEIKRQVNAVVPDNYLAGESVINRDIATSFQLDNVIINVFTVLAILLIVGLTFVSVSVPVLLVAIIQGAIWISMSFSAMLGSPVFFISYIICVCIQMGATIDYGILVTDFYLRARNDMPPKDAAVYALKEAMPTIFTSGSILIIAALIIGLFSSIMPISSIGLLLCRGSVISVLTAMFILPACLVILDKPVLKLTRRFKKNSDNSSAEEQK